MYPETTGIRTYTTTSVPGCATGFTLDSDYTITCGFDATGRFNNLARNAACLSGDTTYIYLTDADLLDQLITSTGYHMAFCIPAPGNLPVWPYRPVIKKILTTTCWFIYNFNNSWISL